jgi:Zn-dependent metalloprotease
MISIGGGMLSTLHVESNTAQWIGYQIIFGAGAGSAMPMVNFSPIHFIYVY